MKKTTGKTKTGSTAGRTSTKSKTGTAGNKGGKFHFVNELHEAITAMATATKTGEVKIKRNELKEALENLIHTGAKRAASGERIRFPVIGTLARRDVKGRKAGKGKNPFTGEEIMMKARPESKKPRWSFPKMIKEVFADKKHW